MARPSLSGSTTLTRQNTRFTEDKLSSLRSILYKAGRNISVTKSARHWFDRFPSNSGTGSSFERSIFATKDRSDRTFLIHSIDLEDLDFTSTKFHPSCRCRNRSIKVYKSIEYHLHLLHHHITWHLNHTIQITGQIWVKSFWVLYQETFKATKEVHQVRQWRQLAQHHLIRRIHIIQELSITKQIIHHQDTILNINSQWRHSTWQNPWSFLIINTVLQLIWEEYHNQRIDHHMDRSLFRA